MIDHIQVQHSFKLIYLLKLENKNNRLSFASNLDSSKIGKKSILKIEDTFFSQSELDLISIFAPNSRINIIKNNEVIKKFNLNPPDRIECDILCPNNRCITRYDKTNSVFLFNKKIEDSMLLSCFYCDSVFKANKLQIL